VAPTSCAWRGAWQATALHAAGGFAVDPSEDARATFGCVPGSSLLGGSGVQAGAGERSGVSSRTSRPSTGRQPPLPVIVENLVSGGMARLRWRAALTIAGRKECSLSLSARAARLRVPERALFAQPAGGVSRPAYECLSGLAPCRRPRQGGARTTLNPSLSASS
jgi:hypothetical protein